MPIYAYRCDDCGHAQDFLQKMSDPLIDTCPQCGSKNFKKQLTAAGFQLKGGGWYVTDFRDNGKKDGKVSSIAVTMKRITQKVMVSGSQINRPVMKYFFSTNADSAANVGGGCSRGLGAAGGCRRAAGACAARSAAARSAAA